MIKIIVVKEKMELFQNFTFPNILSTELRFFFFLNIPLLDSEENWKAIRNKLYYENAMIGIKVFKSVLPYFQWWLFFFVWTVLISSIFSYFLQIFFHIFGIWRNHFGFCFPKTLLVIYCSLSQTFLS